MNTELRFHIIHGFSQLQEHIPQLESSKVFGVDTETTGLDPLQDKVRLVQVATKGNPVILFDMQTIDCPTRAFLRDIMSGTAIKVFQNAKFDMKFLHQSGLPVSGRIFDTFIAGNLLRQKSRLTRFGLDSLVQHYLDVDLSKEQQASDWQGDLSLAQYEYAARDAAVLIPLREAMIRDLQSEGLMEITKLELACMPAVVQMELTGIHLDLDRWQRLGGQLERQREVAAAELYKNLRRASVQLNLFGEDTDTSLNLDSQQQVLKALKEQGVPLRNTARNQLAPLADKYPVVQQLLEYRRATKALQAFIYSIPQAVHPVTGRLHPRYHQMGASTGRFSCGHPNLQQIPRSKDFRSCFVAGPGNKLVIADYSQIELRVVAEISRDTTMIQAYATGQDLHRLTASLVASKPIDEVSKLER